MRNLIFLVSLLACVVARSETVEFKLQTDDPSCKGLAQVVVSQDKMVLYEVEVPASGTGQVHLLTGNYQIEASNKAGCSFQDVIQISDLPNKLMSIRLDRSARKTAAAAGSDTTVDSAPCGWGAYGCGGNYYPHDGNIALAKPHLYLSGKDEGKFKIKLGGSHFNFLATVPSFKDNEVIGELRRGSIYSDNTWYPHMSYDARVSDEHFQSNQGFCGTKNEIFKFMMQGLVKYEFPDEARNDFSRNWGAKLPQALKYCVYPQANAQLDKTAPLEFTFDDKTPTRTERLFYLIIPQDFKGKRIPAHNHRFADKPKSLWKHYTRTVIPKTPYLYEWGVSFMFE